MEMNLLSCLLTCEYSDLDIIGFLLSAPVVFLAGHHCVSDFDMVQETEVMMECDWNEIRHGDHALEDEAR